MSGRITFRTPLEPRKAASVSHQPSTSDLEALRRYRRARRRGDPEVLQILAEALERAGLGRLTLAHHDAEERSKPPGAARLEAHRRLASRLVGSGILLMALAFFGFLALSLLRGSLEDLFAPPLYATQAWATLAFLAAGGLAYVVGELVGLVPAYRFAMAEARVFGGAWAWAEILIAASACLLAPPGAIITFLIAHDLLFP